jgi:glycerophosphoryl diester phosphodiesterase
MAHPRPAFELQGHRGARGLFPENTREGIAATIALGVDAIELDVAIAADGVPVVFHDVALNPDLVRGASGGWIAAPGPLIHTLTFAELARHDVGRLRPGSPTAARHPNQIPRDGARIPRLADILALAVQAGVRVAAELKTLPDRPRATVSPEAMADAVLAVARQENALDLLDVRSFDWRGLVYLGGIAPAVPRTWLTSAETVAAADLWWGRPLVGSTPRTVAAPGGATWAPAWGDLTREAVAEAHALGLRVIPWTVNEAADMARMIAWGADGLCTDRPDIARRVMAEAGLPLPTPPP